MRLSVKILAIVILASVVPLAVLAQLTISGIQQYGEQAKSGVIDVSQDYLTRAGQEAVYMKAQDLALHIQTYIQMKMKLENKTMLTTFDLIQDPEFRKLATQRWGAMEYTWVGAGNRVGDRDIAVLLAHPAFVGEYEKALGLDLATFLRWNETMPDLYNLLLKITENPEAPQPVCGYYKWDDPRTPEKEEIPKYLCHYPTTVKVYDPLTKSQLWVVAGTSAYIDGYFQYLTQNPANPAENIASEVEKAISSAISAVYMNLAIAAVIAVVFLVVLIYYTTSQIANPIVEMAKVADRIAEGEVEATVPYQERADEIGILAKSIERLRRSIKVAMKSLEEALK
ncbi:MAG: HAMP domain-containing protein [Archaeoglobaceae archaeon]